MKYDLIMTYKEMSAFICCKEISTTSYKRKTKIKPIYMVATQDGYIRRELIICIISLWLKKGRDIEIRKIWAWGS